MESVDELLKRLREEVKVIKDGLHKARKKKEEIYEILLTVRLNYKIIDFKFQ